MASSRRITEDRRPKRPEMLLVEDDSTRAHRNVPAGAPRGKRAARITVRVHRINSQGWKVVKEKTYQAGALRKRHIRSKADVAFGLLDGIRIPRGAIATAGSTFGCNSNFLAGLAARGLSFVVEIRPSAKLRRITKGRAIRARTAQAFLRQAAWRKLNLDAPFAATPLKYWAAKLGDVLLPGGETGCLFAAQIGRIPGLHRGTVFGLTSKRDVDLKGLLRIVGWARWIRPAARRQEREALLAAVGEHESKGEREKHINGARLPVRSNIAIARRQDDRGAERAVGSDDIRLRGRLARHSPVVNVAELFAGAGGMGLGFLLANGGAGASRYRLIFSGEINPPYVETLNSNHTFMRSRFRANGDACAQSLVEPMDLSRPDSLKAVRRQAREFGRIDMLIGGPPCQGFSNANRNSWHSANPNNRLVDVFLSYVEALRPKLFLLENVQGVLWTPKGGRSPQLMVMEHFARRMRRAGYEVFPKLLDAVWYGVPQHRSRFFLLGLRTDFGYSKGDFGDWGPFPRPTHGPGCAHPYVTVRDAISDLPRIGNGDDVAERQYEPLSTEGLRGNPFLRSMRKGAPRGVILDHVTSLHSKYVIERYRNIPQGGNWRDILRKLTNYADARRTHSNIYRRLVWSEPAITIGHYRKSMLVHPSQHRGLSLREAARLQSFPDWFRFNGGLVHKQQQLANAVCPLVTKALAEFISRL